MDAVSVARWLDVNFGNRAGTFVPAYCGFHPAERIFQRDSINVRKLTDREFLYNVVAEHAKSADGFPMLANFAERRHTPGL